MLITIDPPDPRPLYVQIIDEVRRALVVGSLEPDDPLPSVRQLAAELKLNPNTVQQAYRELERDGVVYVRRGLGTFAAARDEAGNTDAERRALLAAVAERALLDAHRHGLAAGELIAAIEKRAAETAASPDPPAPIDSAPKGSAPKGSAPRDTASGEKT